MVLGNIFRKIVRLFPRGVRSAARARVRDLILKARKRCDITHGKDMALTQAWYQELKEETGERIINGLCETIRAARWANLRRRFASPPSPPSILNRHLRRARQLARWRRTQRQRQRPQQLIARGTNASWPLFTSSRTSSRLRTVTPLPFSTSDLISRISLQLMLLAGLKS